MAPTERDSRQRSEKHLDPVTEGGGVERAGGLVVALPKSRGVLLQAEAVSHTDRLLHTGILCT